MQVVLMTAMMLPGNAIIYYGDEIGMAADQVTMLTCDQAQDPYSKPPYSECVDHPLISRDPARTPMQVRGS